ncbi:MAG: hypothetical protein FWF75_08715 [Propionibacteriaceae bacterium]|nr:hypothetical protein [Propionibacteriaceae bacterium]
MMVTVRYCGEEYRLAPQGRFSIGREADLVLDEDNPFLHRVFLTIEQEQGLWWMSNVGSHLSATALSREGGFQAWLSPGGRVPLVFPAMTVWFTAGETTYEFEVIYDDAPFQAVEGAFPASGAALRNSADETIGEVALTPEQRVLLVALAEDMLRNFDRGAGSIPRSTDAARRLGWPITKFNRKLDNVCMKFDRMGVRGLHGGPARLATARKARLVEYALGAHIITQADLGLLPGRHPAV